MQLDFSQGTTKRGAVRFIVCVAASYAWYTGDITKAVGAFTVGEALKAYLGIVDEK